MIPQALKSKEQKTRPSVLSRSFSHAFGGSRHNAEQHAIPITAQWHGLPPAGLPLCAYHACDHKRHLSCSDFPRPHGRSSSPHSTTASASDIGKPPSLVSGHSSASTDTSTHYSGFNAAVYAPQICIPAETLPQIHSLLDASSTPLIWDVRTEPKQLQVPASTSQLIEKRIGPNVLSFPLLSTGAGHIRIFSPTFPWSIEIGPKQRGIACSEVLHALYDLLNKELEDAIWGVADDNKRSSILRAWKKRSDSDSRIRNVDWLGKHFMFKGFYRDAKFAQQRLQPGIPDVPETLLVMFGKA